VYEFAPAWPAYDPAMTPPPSLTRRDIDYVTEEYRTLAELCAGRELASVEARVVIDSGQLPRPTYVLPAGRAAFPAIFRAEAEVRASDQNEETGEPAVHR
jgi:hypothetical protein